MRLWETQNLIIKGMERKGVEVRGELLFKIRVFKESQYL